MRAIPLGHSRSDMKSPLSQKATALPDKAYYMLCLAQVPGKAAFAKMFSATSKTDSPQIRAFAHAIPTGP